MTDGPKIEKRNQNGKNITKERERERERESEKKTNSSFDIVRKYGLLVFFQFIFFFFDHRGFFLTTPTSPHPYCFDEN